MAREDIHGRDRNRRGWTLLATLLASTAMGGIAQAQQAENRAEGIGEIIITAEKRAATVQNTPISLTAISGDALAEQGTTDMRGIIAEVPGISMRYEGPGQTELELRGLASSGGSSPTVGFYLDEVPLSPPAASITGKVVIDPDLFDLSRVEVLRGPQGTLYGSGSMGGTIKLVTNQPNLTKYEGALEGILSGTPGHGVNVGGNAMLNAPLIDDTLAVRVVVTDKFTHGWIDRDVVSNFPQPINPCVTWANAAPWNGGCNRGNVLASPVTQVNKDVNFEHLSAGRVSVLYKPSEDLSISTMAMYQNVNTGGASTFDQSYGLNGGNEAHYQPFNLKEPYTDSFAMIANTISYKMSFADLTSATSFWSRVSNQSQDSSEQIENLVLSAFGTPVFGPSIYHDKSDSSQFTQEFRLSSNGEGALQWLGGVFFAREESIYNDYNFEPALAFLDANGVAGNPRGLLFEAFNPYHITQYAVFGEGSYKFLDDWKLTAGLRYYYFDTKVNESQAGILATGSVAQQYVGFKSNSSGVNPKINLAYEPDADLTAYGTISKGFRPGGVNLPTPTNLGCALTDEIYNPDSIWNYEVGEKARFFDRRLIVNADFYYINWNNEQQLVNQSCGYPVTANTGTAHSFGPEVEVSAKILDNLTLSVSGTYTDAQLDKVSAAVTTADSQIAKGTPILDVPKYTSSIALAYVRSLNADFDFTARISDSYVGPQTDISYGYHNLEPYNLVNMRLGLVGTQWSGYLFADNLTDKRAALGINTTSVAWLTPSTTRVATNQPRTIGIDVNYRF
jgi:outer membrane receptor protein involved in Fe transport